MASIVAVLALVMAVGTAPGSPEVGPLVIFWGEGCPHCAAEWEMLSDLAVEYPELEIRGHEVWNDAANRALFAQTMAAIGEEPSGVPTTLFEGRVWVGYSEAAGREIREAVASAFDSPVGPPSPAVAADARTVELPLIGAVDADATSLVVASAVIGFVDGFNPCSLWALSMLLALVLRTGTRGRVTAVGATFLVITAGLYGLYMFGMYSTLEWASRAGWVRGAMAAVALVFGLVNLKDFWWFKRGLSLTIPDRAKPGLYRRMRGVALDSRSLPAVLGGTALLAVGVSLLETPCTAGYPLLWSNLVSSRGVSTATVIALFSIYMIVFLVDEIVVFGMAVGAMRVAKLEERHGRVLKLVSGMLMVVLALVLLFAPQAMQSVEGALVTFAVAAAATGLVLGVQRLVGTPAAR